MPLHDFVQGNSNQPGPKAGFKAKLPETREGFKNRLLNHVVALEIISQFCSYETEQRSAVRFDQNSKQILSARHDLSDQLALFFPSVIGSLFHDGRCEQFACHGVAIRIVTSGTRTGCCEIYV